MLFDLCQIEDATGLPVEFHAPLLQTFRVSSLSPNAPEGYVGICSARSETTSGAFGEKIKRW